MNRPTGAKLWLLIAYCVLELGAGAALLIGIWNDYRAFTVAGFILQVTVIVVLFVSELKPKAQANPSGGDSKPNTAP